MSFGSSGLGMGLPEYFLFPDATRQQLEDVLQLGGAARIVELAHGTLSMMVAADQWHTVCDRATAAGLMFSTGNDLPAELRSMLELLHGSPGLVAMDAASSRTGSAAMGCIGRKTRLVRKVQVRKVRGHRTKDRKVRHTMVRYQVVRHMMVRIRHRNQRHIHRIRHSLDG